MVKRKANSYQLKESNMGQNKNLTISKKPVTSSKVTYIRNVAVKTGSVTSEEIVYECKLFSPEDYRKKWAAVFDQKKSEIEEEAIQKNDLKRPPSLSQIKAIRDLKGAATVTGNILSFLWDLPSGKYNQGAYKD